jgi:hypothetical protein
MIPESGDDRSIPFARCLFCNGLEPIYLGFSPGATDAVQRRQDLYKSRENPGIVILSAKCEESRGFSPLQGSMGILHPLKRVQNDKGICFVGRLAEAASGFHR